MKVWKLRNQYQCTWCNHSRQWLTSQNSGHKHKTEYRCLHMHFNRNGLLQGSQLAHEEVSLKKKKEWNMVQEIYPSCRVCSVNVINMSTLVNAIPEDGSDPLLGFDPAIGSPCKHGICCKVILFSFHPPSASGSTKSIQRDDECGIRNLCNERGHKYSHFPKQLYQPRSIMVCVQHSAV